MKAVFCAYDWPDNVCGPASWIGRLLPWLKNHGIDSTCLVLCWGAAGPLVQTFRERGIDCRVVICEGTTEQRITWILQQLQSLRPDVFIPNLVLPALFAARWVRESGIPTVGVLHSDDEFYHAVKNEFTGTSNRFALSALVCVSRELEQQSNDRQSQKTHVVRIPYGVSVPEHTTTRAGNQLNIAYVGRLSEEQKRISEVTRAFCRAVQEVPGVTSQIIGEGKDRSNVEEILTSANLSSRVTLTGRVSPDKIQARLVECHVIVLLSDYEGLPIALLEAMACGVVPVCMEMRSGIPELVQHEKTGLIVTDRGNDFVDAVRRLKDDWSLWQQLSEAARKRVLAENSEQSSALKWATLLTDLQEQAVPQDVNIPDSFDLPAVNPALAGEDVRAAPADWSNRFGMIAGRFRDAVLGSRSRLKK